MSRNWSTPVAGERVSSASPFFPPLPKHDAATIAEAAAFQRLQQRFPADFAKYFPDKQAPKAIIVIPSLTLDQEILAKVKGHFFYEERLLCLMLLLRMPRTHLTYVTSVPIDPVIIDYYLHLLPGVTGYHARQRLTLLSCFDASSRSLTEKILERPRLMERIRQSIPHGYPAHITCFNVTHLERKLALQLGIPLYGTDPELNFLGTKSGSRKIFRECGLLMPPGMEDVKDEAGIVKALAILKKEHPRLRRAVIKMNDGFSGEGNATFSFEGAPQPISEIWIREQLPQRLRIVAEDLNYERYITKFQLMGGIVEAFIEGETVISPSVQCRINPLGETDVISTHDQILGGDDGQIFLGASFPANKTYAPALAEIGLRVAEALKKYGVMGRFGIDFISVKEGDHWHHYAIEINLRKGGTTHPYLMLQLLTEGVYDAQSGKYLMKNGEERFYIATDNLQHQQYKGLTPYDLIDIAMLHGLHYNGASEEGVMFHLISALSQYGKLGVVCIGSTPERAKAYYEETIRVLNLECCHPS